MGWVWAVAGVVGVFVHEFGHVLAINALGCGPGRIRIIPFLGGAATMAQPPDSRVQGRPDLARRARPSALSPRCPSSSWPATTTRSGWAGAFFVGIINLINLAPAPPLDGSKALGPALARISPMLERVALVLVGAAAVYWAILTGNWLFGAFVGIATLGALRTGVPRFVARPLTGPELAAAIGLWLLALVLCASVVAATSSRRPPSRAPAMSERLRFRRRPHHRRGPRRPLGRARRRAAQDHGALRRAAAFRLLLGLGAGRHRRRAERRRQPRAARRRHRRRRRRPGRCGHGRCC